MGNSKRFRGVFDMVKLFLKRNTDFNKKYKDKYDTTLILPTLGREVASQRKVIKLQNHYWISKDYL